MGARDPQRGCRLSRGGMEATLVSRDQAGVQDFVLLEDYNSMHAFLDNLRKRFNENLIYTYIGSVLVSVNPYKPLDIYNADVMDTYRNVNFYELPPHIFALSDAAYRSVKLEFRDQCILISGESGAGKTEASKKVLQYIAGTSTHSQQVDRVKERLLQSNPLLEAFGNAKTNRNDNSSRFGKYMDIQFDYEGAPIGGVVLNYLLEKSRVVHQASGERNFHVFYQLVSGAPDDVREQLLLKQDVSLYHYLTQVSTASVNSVNDQQDFKVVTAAMKVCLFSQEEQKAMLSAVASILHLGNITFTEEELELQISDLTAVNNMAKLLGCDVESLQFALTNKSIFAQSQKVSSPLSLEQAVYARDALAKGMYERMFSWLVQKINQSLTSENIAHKKAVLGLLDIYGFEIFEVNSFEQFCINYCNEKLQQLFITLTLKSEQDEYLREGIQWEPVQYFNNKIICDLVEGKPMGIIAIMDEECLRPGDVSDESFLEKMSSHLGKHEHFLSHQTASNAERKTIQRNEFRLIHYAGTVTYSVEGFLDKNNDLLFRDLKEVMCKTTNIITSTCFKQDDVGSKKRPETAGSQFRTSMSHLIEILLSKQPSYIRCIKPNHNKRPGIFNDEIVEHQVKYLGLLENVRVRRAGFAYRREYTQFLKRYKPLCPHTWPHYHGNARDGVEKLCTYLKDIYTEEDYKLGKTKIFIRFPRVLFATEDALAVRKHELATMIQAIYKGFKQRKRYLIMRQAVTTIAKYWRRILAKRRAAKRRKAANQIRSFIRGFMMRHEPPCPENEFFINQMRYHYLLRLRNQLPKTVLDKSWPTSSELLRETSKLLRVLRMKNMVNKYVKGISTDRKWQFKQKLVGEDLFKGKKSSYERSIAAPYLETRLTPEQDSLCNGVFKKNAKPREEIIKYATSISKYDRHGYHVRARVLIMTDRCIYLVEEKSFKLKERIPFDCLKSISVSQYSDGLFVLHTSTELNGNKGDLILSSPHTIEIIVKIAMASNVQEHISFATDCIVHSISDGKTGQVDFINGVMYSISKAKTGNLTVINPS